MECVQGHVSPVDVTTERYSHLSTAESEAVGLSAFKNKLAYSSFVYEVNQGCQHLCLLDIGPYSILSCEVWVVFEPSCHAKLNLRTTTQNYQFLA